MEELENGVFTLKTHQEFSVHTTREEFKNAAIPSVLGFPFEGNWVREITWLPWCHLSQKAPFSKCFPSTRKRNRDASVFKLLRFKGRFQKALFSWLTNKHGRFEVIAEIINNFSGVVWTRPTYTGLHTAGLCNTLPYWWAENQSWSIHVVFTIGSVEIISNSALFGTQNYFPWTCPSVIYYRLFWNIFRFPCKLDRAGFNKLQIS